MPGPNQDLIQRTVRYAMTQGYLTPDQVREGLLLQQQLEAANRPTPLLSILVGRGLIAREHVDDVRAAYQRFQREPAGGAAAPQPDAAAPPQELAVPPDEPERELAVPPDEPEQELAVPAEPLAVPEDVLARSGELARRPPETDPEGVKAFIQQAESAQVPLPDIADRVFVALARKVGYPPQQALLGCRKVQIAEGQAGRAVSLFSVARAQGLLKDRQVNRFLRWSAQIERREEKPLEDEDAAPTRREVHTSAANFPVVAPTCKRCGQALDDVALLEGRAEEVDGKRRCVGCAKLAKQERRGQLRTSMVNLARAVAHRVRGEDPAESSRRLIQTAAWTAVGGVAFGLLVGVWFAATGDGAAQPVEPDPTDTALASGRAVADRAWTQARGAPPAALADALAGFATEYPGDPRAADAKRFAVALRSEAEATVAAEETAQRRIQALALARAESLRRSDPGTARALCGLIDSLAPEQDLAERARRLLAQLDADAAGPSTRR